MLDRRSFKGEGTFSEIIERGKVRGYKVSFRLEGITSKELFYFKSYRTRQRAYDAAKRYYNKIDSKIPKLYGLPLRPFKPGDLYPKHHLPMGVNFKFRRPFEQSDIQMNFGVTLIRGIEEKAATYIFCSFRPFTLTESEIVRIQNIAIDVRCDFVECYKQGKPFDVSYVQRGRWEDIQPRSNVTPPVPYLTLAHRKYEELKNKG